MALLALAAGARGQEPAEAPGAPRAADAPVAPQAPEAPDAQAPQETAALLDSVAVVERPPHEARNRHYPGHRAPLEPSRWIELPPGAVRPRGWLEEVLERQRDGLNGRLPAISLWLSEEENAWLSPDGRGRWGFEEVPYWLKGFLSLGYVLDDETLLAEAQPWIEAALASQREDGDFGPRNVLDDGARDFWPNMVMLACLQAHHDFSGDERVIALMRAYFRFQLGVPDEEFLTGYWQHMRGGDNLASVYWLYDRTGDAWLLELATKIHRRTAPWGYGGSLPDWHNVNVAQGFREPATYWLQSHDPADRRATEDAFRAVRDLYGQVPGGMFGGDEYCRPGFADPRQAIETCALVEQMLSDEMLLRDTGDPSWADHCEEVAFNMLPAATMPDLRALRYLTSPNMPVSDAANHAPGIHNAGPYFVMSALSHRCCQHNHGHGWPYFARSLWAATPDEGLCAALYAPSVVTASVGERGLVTIEADTRYPFEESVLLTVRTREPVRFPLYLRVPGWCSDAKLAVNGERAAVRAPGGVYVRLTREWREGDTVAIDLPMRVFVREWRKNHGSISVDYGPLTFSLSIEEDVQQVPADETALREARWRDDVDLDAWPAFTLSPASPWNYALVLDGVRAPMVLERREWPADDYPFTREAVPLTISAKARRVPAWTLDRFGLCAELQQSPVRTGEPVEDVTLIPMGAARLRITAFPVVGEGDDASEWRAPAMPQRLFTVEVSHCYEGDSAAAVADGLEPDAADDHRVPRHTFWPHRGTTEWLVARFDAPRSVSAVGVYWFDDREQGGGCRPPAGRTLSWLDGETWTPVTPEAAPGPERDAYDTIALPEPVATSALRLEVRLEEGFSAGVLEWKIE